MKRTLRKFCNCISDFFKISRQIEDYEVFIRTLVNPKHVQDDGSIPERKLKDYFLPNQGGVSINRYRYANEKESKKLGKKINGYRGFALFNINDFRNCILEYKERNPSVNFVPKIVASPLDTSNAEMRIKYIWSFYKGNLAHADIIYPAIDAENPNTSHRAFSKMLADKCLIKLDSNIDSPAWMDGSFSEKNTKII